MSRLRIFVPVTILLALATAAPSAAQDEGVTIDPNSPSAKEYAIPLESERRQANPRQHPGDRIQQGSRSSPLFGEGIEPARGASGDGTKPSSDGTGTSGSGVPGATAREGRASTRKSETQATAAEVLRATSNPGAPAGSVDTVLIIAAVAAAVLALGAGAGLLLRRRRS
jgi:hypothetical protein